MTVHPPLRRRVLEGDVLFGTFLNLGSPQSAEICAQAGLDWVLVDLEHGAATEADLLPHLWAVKGTGASALVRVEQGTRLRIGRALDLGADGVMVPQVRSAQEAAEIGSWLRFPPAGRRGVALSTRGLGLGRYGHDHVAARNEEILGIVQVESGAAVEATNEIAAVDGVDVLFVGPTDLSHALGIPGRLDDPAYLAAVDRVADAARGHGKAAGVLVWKAEDVVGYLDRGYTFFSLSGDGQWLRTALSAALGTARSLAEDARTRR
jgi:2-dehydro-3-deoxyglucarate aldolase/4-hydroxy-2-oxoheptanedioate aldolase